MASIIEGYAYDVFISYRQKDNRHDSWVTEFVENLKGELESTFKEEISVYFDINSHDGLLETHDVDASLKEKLKCVIFIPVISQTYCDPKSFAWKHEFMPFVEMASKDQFGLKVKLSNGNVANRVLPVRIHELDINDIKLCESLLGGVLRGIDFIYRSVGVNRPLRSNEDHPHDNHNKTYYRDQINKVANAIKEIICCFSPSTETQEVQSNDLPGLVSEITVHSSSPDHNYSAEKQPASGTEKVNSDWRRILAFSVLALLLGISGTLLFLRTHQADEALTTYSNIQVNSPITDLSAQFASFAISPDGRTIAYDSEDGIKIKSLSGFSTRLLEGTEGAGIISFSPDGQSLVFASGYDLYKIGLTGSPRTLIYPKGGGPGFSWGIDNYIYFAAGLGEGIWRVSVNGGDAEKLTSVKDSLGESAHTWPQLLPDAKTLLYTALGPGGVSTDSRIVIQQLQSKTKQVLIDRAAGGVYLSSGRILYCNNDGNLFIVPFDLHHLKITGEPEAVLSGLASSTWSGAPFFSVSSTGNIIFLQRALKSFYVLDIVDREGKLVADSIPEATFDMLGHGWNNLSISSGNILACTGRTFGTAGDIWILNLHTGDPERITFDLTAEEEFPVLSPGDDAVAYTSSMPGSGKKLYIKDLSSSAGPSLIREWPGHFHLSSWSPDGKWLAGYDYNKITGFDCYAISVNSGDSIPVAAGKANEYFIQFSPDGHWLAYQSDESGRYEIYVVSFPDLKRKKQVSLDGATIPRWDRTGKYIYYISNGYIVAQSVEIGTELKKGKTIRLFPTNASNFVVSPGGDKFYLYHRNEKAVQPVNLITNWFEELKKKK